MRNSKGVANGCNCNDFSQSGICAAVGMGPDFKVAGEHGDGVDRSYLALGEAAVGAIKRRQWRPMLMQGAGKSGNIGKISGLTHCFIFKEILTLHLS